MGGADSFRNGRSRREDTGVRGDEVVGLVGLRAIRVMCLLRQVKRRIAWGLLKSEDKGTQDSKTARSKAKGVTDGNTRAD
ncbi:hypothetical protein PC129_g17896 [Phytophthora cactorum]|uniref:Uncharacterized protein n=1 Tax=Phytophthora cactorum TaxID=29920 RepID=A0A8T1B9S8_9STRA|nr:hypothetical protein PC114_g23734 [Phytophthora cactorum]KAG2897342.1 hypothetical protein PC117_g22804 [Phytophthora cactorum]KAG2987290.1 hypothetical protein PC119_g19713 [Phytophthora cactorum]KAG2987295.1 hypothetical protein PC119_g19723 [Phytophthora cactorum]KAG3025050.1 hypothetical protein PC120_g6688 [Phytophthora cactorum]